MTAHKHLKERIRARMEKTGESYASARRQVLAQATASPAAQEIPWHFPGCIPASTALRSLLTYAGITAPRTGQPLSEVMVFGIAGGIGAGVFSFYYAKADHASFFVSGRHSWWDHVAYFKGACRRIAVEPLIQETAGTKTAEKLLREALQNHGPCIAWVDMYQIITIYSIQDEEAVIGDRTDEPMRIALADLAKSRAVVKKDKNRLLSLLKPATPMKLPLDHLIKEGLRACHQGLLKQRMANFTLAAFRTWGQRMHGSKDKESWERLFRPGPNLWRGLASIYNGIEHHGSGGGLCRPMFAAFLEEAAEYLTDARLKSLAEKYSDLGRRWSELAYAALPENVPPFREARQLSDRKAELTAAGNRGESCQQRLDDLERRSAPFPLSEEASAELRRGLQARILDLYDGEMAAHAVLGAMLS
jgi:hypothetical protein